MHQMWQVHQFSPQKNPPPPEIVKSSHEFVSGPSAISKWKRSQFFQQPSNAALKCEVAASV